MSNKVRIFSMLYNPEIYTLKTLKFFIVLRFHYPLSYRLKVLCVLLEIPKCFCSFSIF